LKFHHMAVFVSDMEQSLRLYRDTLGFKVAIDDHLPNGDAPGVGVLMYPELMDRIWDYRGARSRVVLLTSEEGAMLELQQSLAPPVQSTPAENLRYWHTGIHELGLQVSDIDDWFKTVRDAGYETQTEEVWEIVGMGRSFLFYDPDWNLIQLWENPSGLESAW
jgi:catechol 2,3-dioxygenase-like lactoylglutathione lyase family enzyme